MDTASFSALLNNVILLLGLGVIYDTMGLHSIANRTLRDSVSGVLVGAIGVAVMSTPWELEPGIFFDSRWVLLSLCGLFFGFRATVIAVCMTVAFRLYQGGGARLLVQSLFFQRPQWDCSGVTVPSAFIGPLAGGGFTFLGWWLN